MRVICFLCLDNFYAHARGKTGDEWVLHHEGRVLDVSAGAEARGVSVGMGKGEAKTMLAGTGQFEAWEPSPYEEAQEKWLSVVARYSDAIEPVTQDTAYVDLSGHPKPEATARHITKTLGKSGFYPRSGLASTRFVAKLAASYEGANALHAPKQFLAKLRVENLPAPPEVAVRLRLLGYGTIGQVAAVPKELLRPVFGDIAHELELACRGRGDAHVEALYPPQSITTRFMFENPVDSLETFDLGLKQLAERLSKRLLDEDGFSECLELCLEFEDGQIVSVSRNFARSIHTTREALAALRLILKVPPKAAIIGMQARLKDVKRSRRVQAPLAFSNITDGKDERSKLALAHLKEAFGTQAVQFGSELEGPRWKQVRRAYRVVNGWTW